MIKNVGKDTLKTILTNPKEGPRNHIISDCPYCGKAGHFYIRWTTGLWDCKKCSQAGNIFRILKKLNKLYLLGGREVDYTAKTLLKVNTVFDRLDKFLLDEEELETENILVDKVWRRVNTNSYLRSERGFRKEDFQRYNVGRIFGDYNGSGLNDYYRKRHKGYINFLITEGGEPKGFVGRSEGWRKIKYFNSNNTQFAKLLMGFDEITENTVTVILVEGFFDKRAVDIKLGLFDDESVKCCATFGKKLSQAQMNKLFLLGVQNLVFLYDGDAVLSVKKLIRDEHLKAFFKVSVISIEDDPDETDQDTLIMSFMNPYSPVQYIHGKLPQIKKS